jgi:hypothetical protein
MLEAAGTAGGGTGTLPRHCRLISMRKDALNVQRGSGRGSRGLQPSPSSLSNPFQRLSGTIESERGTLGVDVRPHCAKTQRRRRVPVEARACAPAGCRTCRKTQRVESRFSTPFCSSFSCREPACRTTGANISVNLPIRQRAASPPRRRTAREATVPVGPTQTLLTDLLDDARLRGPRANGLVHLQGAPSRRTCHDCGFEMCWRVAGVLDHTYSCDRNAIHGRALRPRRSNASLRRELHMVLATRSDSPLIQRNHSEMNGDSTGQGDRHSMISGDAMRSTFV